MMVKWAANDGLLQANDGKMPVNDGEFLPLAGITDCWIIMLQCKLKLYIFVIVLT